MVVCLKVSYIVAQWFMGGFHIFRVVLTKLVSIQVRLLVEAV